ncbi:MAG: DUF1501 domain-containing protein, partial [Planctomycetota bacterium]|nr:DUF1501 domain-containing protein [Planctomycetota bacterium]
LQLAETFDRRFQSSFEGHNTTAYAELYDEALKVMNSRDLAAFDTRLEPDSVREEYGEGRFARGCLLARRLIEHDLRFVEVVSGGWDTHNDNFEQVRTKAGELDQALSALLRDLRRRGLLDETLVVVATEFGRSPKITATEGRDHHPKAFSFVLAGGGVTGGTTHGITDDRGNAVLEGRTTVPDFNATIAYALGLNTEQVVHSPTGRPFTVAAKGRPLSHLFA